MSGSERAAVLVLALGEEQGSIWGALDDAEINEISQAMAGLGAVPAPIVEALLAEFVSGAAASGAIRGSMNETRKLLTSMMPAAQAAAILEEISGPAGRTMWDKLGNVSETVLASYLKNEYPQTVAVVLSKIRTDHAARVLSILPEDFALECVGRMLRMEPVHREVLDEVERTLRTEFMSNLAQRTKRDSHEAMAKIFNNFDRLTEARLLAGLEKLNREGAERVRALMFVFEDLSQIDPGGIQTLLRGVDKDVLALALKGASDSLRELFFANMSERAAKIMREDMDGMGPVRLKDVSEAQTNMVLAAIDLADKGDIILPGSGGQDELVY